MSRAEIFTLRIIRGCAIDGRRVLAGATVDVEAQTAIDLVQSGAARLQDEADVTVLADLIRPAQVRPRILTR